MYLDCEKLILKLDILSKRKVDGKSCNFKKWVQKWSARRESLEKFQSSLFKFYVLFESNMILRANNLETC